MTSKERTMLTIATVVNIAIIVMEIIGLILCINRMGNEMFIYYTTNSNVFTLITSGLFAIFSIKALKQGDMNIIPKWTRVLKLMSTCCLTITFIIVITVLAPVHEGGYMHMLFEDELLYYHLLCPVLSIISFIFLENNGSLNTKNCLMAVLPTLVYAIISVILNIFRVIYGPYPFLHIYEQDVLTSVIWFVAIVGSSFVISCILMGFARLVSKVKSK